MLRGLDPDLVKYIVGIVVDEDRVADREDLIETVLSDEQMVKYFISPLLFLSHSPFETGCSVAGK